MRKLIWAAAAAVPLAFVLTFAVIATRVAPVIEPPPAPVHESEPDIPLPDLVAGQIERGDLTCPKQSSLRYEACLLYQGALGIWRNVGFREACQRTTALQKNLEGDPPPRNIEPDDGRNAPKSSCFRSIYSILVANSTPILSSTAVRAFYLTATPAFAEPGRNAELCIQVRHGICGNQAAVGLAFMQLAQIEARTVKFFYEKNGKRLSHINIEVLIDGAWRLVDTTYGAYWNANPGSVNSFALATTDQILNDKRIQTNPTFNAALIPYTLYSQIVPFEPFEYLTQHASIIRGESGTIDIDLDGAKGSERFENIPNYVGDNVSDHHFSGVAFALDVEEKRKTINLTVNVSGTSISGEDPVWMCVDVTCLPFDKNVQILVFRAVNPTKLYIKTRNDVTYAMLKSIKWEVSAAQ